MLLYPSLKASSTEEFALPLESGEPRIFRLYKNFEIDYPWNRDEGSSLDFAISITIAGVDSIRSSKLYFGRYSLDFRLDALQGFLAFGGLRRLHYTSSTEKFSEKDLLRNLDREGGPDAWDLRTEDVELWLDGHGGRRLPTLQKGSPWLDFMESLTGWWLVFGEEALSVITKGARRLSQWKKMGKAFVTVWKKESEIGTELHLLIRASMTDEERIDNPWLSTSC